MNKVKLARSKIDAAFLAAEERGLNVSRTELGNLLYPDATNKWSVRVCVNYVLSGRTKRLSARQLRIIADYLQCSIDDLI